MTLKSHRIPLLLVLFILLSGGLTACAGDAASGESSHQTAEMPMASLDDMPQEVKDAPVSVQQAYQFNAANPDVMTEIPCYCGCGSMGHTSNYDCYVADVAADGAITYDSHALGCSICVDITQDSMRLLKQGKTVAEVKADIDRTYAQYGPSNIP
ncbi:MAG TPA: PCYCGC motif-containing (lipo)protein [Anaerolineales bacterium]|nr:PCYCGC motif-containing (lipo)protein [Anaerolineales bacterium]